jgi:hypothetical protein
VAAIGIWPDRAYPSGNCHGVRRDKENIPFDRTTHDGTGRNDAGDVHHWTDS